jgi:LmbE family N-acetylglucosaminyl deacetylase
VTTLYLSPHLDDVVLSCSARILADGDQAVIATVFSRGDGYEVRRAEDRLACERLDAEPLWLDLPDAPFRSGFYRSFRAICLEEDPTDRAFLGEVTRVVGEAVRRVGPQRVVAPLAVGTHIDHRLVHEAARAVEGRVEFYEDRPYVFVRHALAMRLSELEWTAELPAPSVAEFLQSFREATYVRSYLPLGAERFRCALRLARRLRVAAGRVPVEPRIVMAPDLDRVAHAVSAYASQIPDLFGSMDGWKAAAAAYGHGLGMAGYAERSWGPISGAARPGSSG